MKHKLLLVFIVVIQFFIATKIIAQSQNIVSSSRFVLFTNAGLLENVGATAIKGDIGTNVGTISGFPPGSIIGQKYVADTISGQAAAEVEIVYAYLNGMTCGTSIKPILGNNQVLIPDTYCIETATSLLGNLILDAQGNPDALFIFKINGTLLTSTSSNVILINKASICNVYWHINGAFQLGDSSVFRGNIITNDAINLLTGATLVGRGLSRKGPILLHNNTITIGKLPMPVTIKANDSTTFFAGNSIILSGNVDGTWSNGLKLESINVNTSGNYFVTNTSTCGNITSNHIIVTVLPIPVIVKKKNSISRRKLQQLK